MREYANAQCVGNLLFYAWFQLISLALNTCLCIDLILTISDPFSPARSRLKWYYLWSVLSSSLVILLVYMFDPLIEEFDCVANASDKIGFARAENKLNVIIAVSLSIYVVIAIYSLIFTIRRLTRPGVSVAVRNMFIRKHFFYVFVFIFIWMIQQAKNYSELFDPIYIANDVTIDTRVVSGHVSYFKRLS